MTRSRSRWNAGRIGSSASGRKRPLVASLLADCGARIWCSRASSCCRIEIPGIVVRELITKGLSLPTQEDSTMDASHWQLRGAVRNVRCEIAEWDAAAGAWQPRRFFQYAAFDRNGRVVQLDQRGA